MTSWRRRLSDVYQQVQAKRRREWPHPENEFVPASELVDRGATDEEVHEAVAQLEDAER